MNWKRVINRFIQCFWIKSSFDCKGQVTRFQSVQSDACGDVVHSNNTCSTLSFRKRMKASIFRFSSPQLLIVPLFGLVLFSFIYSSRWMDQNSYNRSCEGRHCVFVSEFDSSVDGISREIMEWQTVSQEAFRRLLTEPSLSPKCHNISTSKADFDTVEVYPTLNFQVKRPVQTNTFLQTCVLTAMN